LFIAQNIQIPALHQKLSLEEVEKATRELPEELETVWEVVRQDAEGRCSGDVQSAQVARIET